MQGEQEPPSLLCSLLSFSLCSLIDPLAPTSLSSPLSSLQYISLSSPLLPLLLTLLPVLLSYVPFPPPLLSLRVTPHCPLASLYYFCLPSGLVRLVLRGSRQPVLWQVTLGHTHSLVTCGGQPVIPVHSSAVHTHAHVHTHKCHDSLCMDNCQTALAITLDSAKVSDEAQWSRNTPFPILFLCAC